MNRSHSLADCSCAAKAGESLPVAGAGCAGLWPSGLPFVLSLTKGRDATAFLFSNNTLGFKLVPSVVGMEGVS